VDSAAFADINCHQKLRYHTDTSFSDTNHCHQQTQYHTDASFADILNCYKKTRHFNTRIFSRHKLKSTLFDHPVIFQSPCFLCPEKIVSKKHVIRSSCDLPITVFFVSRKNCHQKTRYSIFLWSSNHRVFCVPKKLSPKNTLFDLPVIFQSPCFCVPKKMSPKNTLFDHPVILQSPCFLCPEKIVSKKHVIRSSCNLPITVFLCPKKIVSKKHVIRYSCDLPITVFFVSRKNCLPKTRYSIIHWSSNHCILCVPKNWLILHVNWSTFERWM
jgi:PII-like signaling protein